MVSRGNAIEAACARKPSCLFIYLPTRERGYDLANRLNPRVDSPPHSWPGVDSNRVPACILRAIDHPERPPSPGDRSPPSVANPSASSRRLLSLSPSPSLFLSPPNPFKKHLFTFRIFRTVLPTAANETRRRGAAQRVRAQLQTIPDWDSNRTRSRDQSIRFARMAISSVINSVE